RGLRPDAVIGLLRIPRRDKRRGDRLTGALTFSCDIVLLRQPDALNRRSLDAHLAVEVHEVINDPQPAQAVAPELEELEALVRDSGAGGRKAGRLQRPCEWAGASPVVNSRRRLASQERALQVFELEIGQRTPEKLEELAHLTVVAHRLWPGGSVITHLVGHQPKQAVGLVRVQSRSEALTE